MTDKVRIEQSVPVRMVDLGDERFSNSVSEVGSKYLGAQRLTMADNAQATTLPTGTNKIILVAEGAAIRYAINTTATSSSAGYVPIDCGLILRVPNLTSLSIYGATGAYANLVYFN